MIFYAHVGSRGSRQATQGRSHRVATQLADERARIIGGKTAVKSYD